MLLLRNFKMKISSFYFQEFLNYLSDGALKTLPPYLSTE
jgi:hypothetical protein